MSEKIFLTRNQLAKFLPTPEAIKAFENLFKIASQQTPNNIDEVQISAETALSMANYSLSVLDNVSKLIEALELQPPETPTIFEDVIDIPIVNINECECLEIIKEPDWNFIKNHPTTISGYGITDAYSAVVADAPLTGSGTTSSHLSIPAATSLANGYLSSTDWSTFNNKQSAYANLSSIGSLANSSGWLHNDGSGVFAYSTPTKSDIGLSNVTNNAQVTSVTGTAPISSSGGTTPAISIDKADATHNGYLSSTDWSTFNSKQSALTTGNLTETTSSILTITGGTGAIIGSGTTIAVTKSDATHSGYLSSTDWGTFNSKEPAQTKGSITEATSSVLTITNGNNSTVGPNVTIQVKQSTNAVSGYLSSTDWTTFNGKQAAYTNLTSIGGLANGTGWLKNNGSGTFSYSTPTATDVGLGNVTNNAQVKAITSTANKLVKFSDTSSTITNSVIYDDGTKVGIGTSSPVAVLTLDGGGGGSLPATYTGGFNMAFGSYGIVMRAANSGGHANIIFQNSSGIVEGTIYSDGSSTSYITSSDYRLKENIQPMTGATDRLKALKPINFAWKVNGSRVDGFLAHETQEVVPEAVTGTKDAMIEEEYEVTPAVPATYDEEGNELTPAVDAVMGTREIPDYQGIDQSKLVPLLTKALQEAVERIEQLEARIEALEMTKQS